MTEFIVQIGWGWAWLYPAIGTATMLAFASFWTRSASCPQTDMSRRDRALISDLSRWSGILWPIAIPLLFTTLVVFSVKDALE